MCHSNPSAEHLGKLISDCSPSMLISGAGLSTAAGIPAYRDASGQWRHRPALQAKDFYHNEDTRQQYWARSQVGWPLIAATKPTRAHQHITTLERYGLIHCIVTQNVDNLHQRAHAKHVIDLHGNLQYVRCLNCHSQLSRASVQHQLNAQNPTRPTITSKIMPDGDANEENDKKANINVPHCPQCAGTLKPDVVLFGENVPMSRVDYCYKQLQQSKLLLCVGSSLMAFSSFRFCRAAAQAGIPIAIINLGFTRADSLATLKLEQNCCTAFGSIAQQLNLISN